MTLSWTRKSLLTAPVPLTIYDTKLKSKKKAQGCTELYREQSRAQSRAQTEHKQSTNR